MQSVCVVLSTYNVDRISNGRGTEYFLKQLNSLKAQKLDGVEMFLSVRDDSKGSTKAYEILDEYRKEGVLKMNIVGENTNTNVGFADSFYLALQAAPDCDYYAFCDQDDIWDEDKLQVAIDALRTLPEDKPNLYYCAHRAINKDDVVTEKCSHRTFDQPKELALESVFTFNRTLGNTCVFNRRAKELYLKYELGEIRFQDWTINVICSAIGNVIFDHTPHISYRLHENNCFGPISFNWKSIKKFFKYMHDYEFNNTRLIEMQLLKKNLYDEIPEEKKYFVDIFSAYKTDKSAKKALLRYKPYFTKKAWYLRGLNRFQIRIGKL